MQLRAGRLALRQVALEGARPFLLCDLVLFRSGRQLLHAGGLLLAAAREGRKGVVLKGQFAQAVKVTAPQAGPLLDDRQVPLRQGSAEEVARLVQSGADVGALEEREQRPAVLQEVGCALGALALLE